MYLHISPPGYVRSFHRRCYGSISPKGIMCGKSKSLLSGEIRENCGFRKLGDLPSGKSGFWLSGVSGPSMVERLWERVTASF